MVKGNEVIGLKIVSLSDGKELGKVKDLMYDPRAQKVRALLIENPGLWHEAQVIAVKNIHAIGKDAVTIDNEDLIQKASELPQPVPEISPDKRYLDKADIVTEDGTDLGQVTDIWFDDSTGKVTEFEVSQGLVKNMQSGKKRIRVEDISTVGPDATIVKNYTEETVEEQGQSQGLEGAVKAARAKGPELAQQAKQKVEEIRQNPEVQETIGRVKTDIDRATTSAKQAVNEARTKAQETTDAAKTEAAKTEKKIKQEAQAYQRRQASVDEAKAYSQTNVGALGGQSKHAKGEVKIKKETDVIIEPADKDDADESRDE